MGAPISGHGKLLLIGTLLLLLIAFFIVALSRREQSVSAGLRFANISPELTFNIISYQPGLNGDPGSLHLRISNVGTVPAYDVRLTGVGTGPHTTCSPMTTTALDLPVGDINYDDSEDIALALSMSEPECLIVNSTAQNMHYSNYSFSTRVT